MSTLVRRNGVAILDLSNVVPPPLSRRAIEKTWRDEDDDVYEMGHRHAGELVFDVLLGSTHLELLDAWVDETVDAYVLVFADGAEWAFAGYITGFYPRDPVDGALLVTITVQPTGAIWLLAP